MAGQTYALPLYGYGRRLKETTTGHDTTRSTHPTDNPPNTHARTHAMGNVNLGHGAEACRVWQVPAVVLGALYAGRANGFLAD